MMMLPVNTKNDGHNTRMVTLESLESLANVLLQGFAPGCIMELNLNLLLHFAASVSCLNYLSDLSHFK